MPLPKPRKGEAQADFISRCAADVTMNADFPDNKQRIAVCHNQWRDAHPGAAPAKATMKPPMPNDGESASAFHDRCMRHPSMTQYQDEKFRARVCQTIWDKPKKPASNQNDLPDDLMRWIESGVKPPSKAPAGSCTPGGGEGMVDFLERCVESGETEAACLAAWHAGPMGDGMMNNAPVSAKTLGRDRLYSVVEVKGINEGHRTIGGIATTPNTDHVGDIVESMGAKYRVPLPLLWQHRHDSPVGEVTWAEPNEKGIPFQARIARIDEPGELKNLTDKAWQAVKAGLVKGVSIGFSPVKDQYELIKGGGIRFKEWTWHELSLVTVPANADATISLIRSLDTEALQAATSQKQGKSVKPPPGASGRATASKPEGTMATKTIAETIAAYASTRAAHAARQDELMSKANDEGVTLADDDAAEYDELEEKIAALDEHLKRLRKQEQRNIQMAVAVDGDQIGRNAGTQIERPHAFAQVKRQPVEKGTAFVRYVAALAMSKGNIAQAAALAQREAWRDTPEVANVLNFAMNEGTTQLKAAVTPATSYDTTWAGPLVQYQYMTSEFIDLLRPATVLDRLTGFRRVPFNIRVPTQTSGSTAYWVGEGSVKPMSSAAFNTVTMQFAKVAALVAFTQESLRFSNPSLEALVRQDMIAAIAKKLDYDLLDPSKAAGTGSGGPSPASLTNGVTAINATGTDAASFLKDARTLLNTIAALDIPMTGGTWVMHPTQAISLSLILNALGQPEFPTVTPEGGTLLGFRVLTTTNLPSSGGSPSDGYMMAFIIPGEILLADDGNVTIDASDQASLQFDSVPDSPPTASTNMISLWQANLIALRAEREINWYKRRTGAVQYIDYAKYSP